MLLIGVETLSYTDIGVNSLCCHRGINLILHIGVGVETLSYTDIGVNSLCCIGV